MAGRGWCGFCSRILGFLSAVGIGLVGFGVAGGAARAQQLPPPEPPKPMPTPQAETPTLRVTTNVVLVPTLVEKDHGQVIYGLKTPLRWRWWWP